MENAVKNFVYVIGSPDGPQKIGIAKDVQKRRKEIQTGSHFVLQLASAIEVPIDLAVHVECYAHWLLRDCRLAGEWFRVSPGRAIVAVREALEAVQRGERQGRRSVGRKKLWAENVNLTLPAGARARMDAALEEGEDRLDLIRKAIERELKRREKGANKPGT